MFDCAWEKIPARLRPGLARYLTNGVIPGSFLTAVLCNDLAAAVRHCDDPTLSSLKAVLDWMGSCAPSSCHGSTELVSSYAAWRKQSPAPVLGCADFCNVSEAA